MAILLKKANTVNVIQFLIERVALMNTTYVTGADKLSSKL
jgi:hypothetical protein